MMDRERIIEGLEMSYKYSNVDENNTLVPQWIVLHALALLKAQEVATVEPKRIELADETKTWLDKMDAVDALSNIADICIDWDGYRTANGLGGLINEIWAYARYCADKLQKSQEPRVMTYNDFIDNPNIDSQGFLPAWIEYRRDGEWGEYWNGDDDEWSSVRADNYNGNGYRCWTSRPTKKQMEAVPWN